MDKNTEEKRKRHRRRHHHRPKGPRKQEGAEQAQTVNTIGTEELLTPEAAQETSVAIPTDDSDPEYEFLKKEEAAPAVEPEEKVAVVSVRFRPVGKAYSFDPNGETFKMGDHVIVETSQGQEFGTVSTPVHNVSLKDIVSPLRKVLRKATEKDLEKHEKNRELELRARKVFQDKTAEHKLDMALSDVECSFDHQKLIFYFTSEGRVDFREFVKDMASVFKMRIELRQIGVRDEAKQLGGLGICGRPLCCSLFLDDFQQVSIKMAKEQNLSLNPTKISGTCGRLMCCLRYENDVYVEAGKTCPRAENAVMTPEGRGIVVESNILCGKCKVRLDSDPENIVPYEAKDLKVIPKAKKNQLNSKNENEKE